MPYALLEELQAEFKTVSHAMSKIDELPEFVENVIWLEIQRLLEKNADLTDRITRAENLLKWVRKQDGILRFLFHLNHLRLSQKSAFLFPVSSFLFISIIYHI